MTPVSFSYLVKGKLNFSRTDVSPTLTLADEVARLRKQIEAYQERQRRLAKIADEFDRLCTEWYFSPQLSKTYSDAASKIREALGE